MNYFLKLNKNLLTISLFMIIIFSIFGINFFISFLGNIVLLLFLIPSLILLLVFVGFQFYKSKINTCSNCGAISSGLSDNCMYCGGELKDLSEKDLYNTKPSESTIEVKAEEIK